MSSTSPDLPLVVTTQQYHVTVASGVGRLLSEAYLAGGRFIGNEASRLAHRMGYGPDAASERIEKHLERDPGV